MKKSKFNKAFIPVFTGIKPTANMTLPTYLRQVQYLEQVLNKLIDEVEINFGAFNEYTVGKLAEIKDKVNDTVSDITTETVTDEVIRVVAIEIEEFITGIANVRRDVSSVSTRVNENRDRLTDVEYDAEQVIQDLEDTSIELRVLIADAKTYTDSKLVEAKTYTDTKVGELQTDIEAASGDLNVINTIIDAKVLAVATRVNKNDIDIDKNKEDIFDITISLEGVDEKDAVRDSKLANIEYDANAANTLAGDVNIFATSISEKVEVNIVSLENVNERLSGIVFTNEGRDTLLASHTGEIDGLDGRVLTLESMTPGEGGGDNSVLVGRVDLLENDQAGVISDVGELKSAQLKYVEDKIGERLESVESDMDISNNPYQRAPIIFKGSLYNTHNHVFNLGYTHDGTSIYKGRLSYQYRGMKDFTAIETLVGQPYAEPLNIAQELTGKSIFSQNPVINYEGSYKDSDGELVKFDGLELKAEYKVGEGSKLVGYDKIYIESFKINDLYTELKDVEMTDFKLNIVADVELAFENLFVFQE